MKIAKLALTFILASTGLVTGLTRPAHADTVGNCRVSALYVRDYYMHFTCQGSATEYRVFGSGAGCAESEKAQPDTFKIWVSMLQGAFLSGRKLNVDFNPNSTCTNQTTAIAFVL